YVVAASYHAERLLPGDFRGRVYRPQGWISPVLLVNGRMEGTWRHEIKRSALEVVVEPFSKTPVWLRRLAGQEAERLAAFFGGTLIFEWKNGAAGPRKNPVQRSAACQVASFDLTTSQL